MSVLLLLLLGCQAGRTIEGTGATADSGGTSDSGNPMSTGSHFGSGSAMGCVSAPTCSSDLKHVLCDGNIVTTCGPRQGCGNGTCIDACEAARLHKSSVGCEYFAANPDTTFSDGACYAAFVANTRDEPVKLKVERAGQQLDVTQFGRIPIGAGPSLSYGALSNGEIPPREVAILFLAQYSPGASYTPACPSGIKAALESEDAALHRTGIGNAFRITTDLPVVGFDIFPYGGGPSAITGATLLLPSSAWDTNYLGVHLWETPTEGVGSSDTFSWLQIIAAENDTDVTIRPTSAIAPSADVDAAPINTPTTYRLQQGEILQFSQGPLLGGSPIQSSKPVGVVAGNRCMTIPAVYSFCDAAHQMIPPVRALGSEYVAVPHRERYADLQLQEDPPWRLMGVVDGTVLTYDPPIGGPSIISAGEIVEFSTLAKPFVVKSQDEDHPFYMAAHMTGCGSIGEGTDCRGDPETVNVIPPAQYLSNYIFFTDPTYPETPLTIVRKRTAQGFADVTVDCMGTVSGWSAVGTSGEYEFAYVDLSVGNFQPVGNCNNGRREASSNGPFTVTVWGWGSAITGGDPFSAMFPFSQAVSYAYPAGAGVRSITDIVVDTVPK